MSAESSCNHYNPDHALVVGRVSIDPHSRYGKRLYDSKEFHLRPGELTILRILDGVEEGTWISIGRIALTYELTREINFALKNRSEKKLAEIEKRYTDDVSEALGTEPTLIHMLINSIRKKVGPDVIETRLNHRLSGYRLAKLPEDKS